MFFSFKQVLKVDFLKWMFSKVIRDAIIHHSNIFQKCFKNTKIVLKKRLFTQELRDAIIHYSDAFCRKELELQLKEIDDD